MADSIIKGVPQGYVAPAQAGEPAGGIAIGATKNRELRVFQSSDANQDTLRSIEELLRFILLELMLRNEWEYPQINWDNERADYDKLYNDPRGVYSVFVNPM